MPVLSRTFVRFFESEKAGGMVLVASTALAIGVANSPLGGAYAGLWQREIFGLAIEQWVNEGLMAIFFLLVGLELERELYVGELSEIRSALLPIVAALGGVAAPAAIHFALNAGTPTQSGSGIPMATDIAFALGVLSLLGRRIPSSLKVFLAALAVIDDLAAVVVIAVFYPTGLSPAYLTAALGAFAILVALNRARVFALWPYLLGGAAMWALMLKSGVHPTVAGVLLAFAIPFSARAEDEESPSHRVEHALHRPVAFLVLPVFALANAGIVVDAGSLAGLYDANGVGIVLGLVAGKPAGIALASAIAIALGACVLPGDMRWTHLVGAGLLGGIGFTMSIFIANLAFPGMPEVVNASKMAILVASAASAVFGTTWLLMVGRSARDLAPARP